ncbi:hypothetical protein AB0M23_28680 [Streptomyces sp. NPDC052077]|uniref:hypothetical protein n=1 Tax=Streptomyces sp. NPDC052077 TaxID=3154757 RepID=UPI0034499ADE
MARRRQPPRITVEGVEAVALTVAEYEQLLACRRQVGGQSARLRVLGDRMRRTERLLEDLAELVADPPDGRPAPPAPGADPASPAPGADPASPAPGADPASPAPGADPAPPAPGADPAGHGRTGRADGPPDTGEDPEGEAARLRRAITVLLRRHRAESG